MRISDWSSDVCSSDLDPLGANRVVDLQRSITDNQQFIRNMDTITTQISLADSAAESMSNQLVRARELAIIAANGTMTATDRQNISTELAQIIEQVLALANTRSEEHTSELQSLMRISYAVFCLKKKKYT